MDELFKVTFASIHEHISGSASVSKHLMSSPTKAIYQNERAQRRERLQALRARTLARVYSSLREHAATKELLQFRRSELIDKCSQYYYFALRQLLSQSANAERRMRELVFEVIGEYGKSVLRAKRRHIFLRFSNRVDRIWSIFVMRWKVFTHRLIYEALMLLPNGITTKADEVYSCYKVLCPSKDAREMKLISQVLASVVTAKVVLCGVVKMNLSQCMPSTPPTGNNRTGHNTSTIATTPHEVRQLIDEVKHRLMVSLYAGQGAGGTKGRSGSRTTHSNGTNSHPPHPPSRPPSSSSIIDSPKYAPGAGDCMDFLRLSVIEWLRPCSYCPISEATLLRLDPSSKEHKHHRKHSRQNPFDCFSSRFVSQHSAFSSSEFVYFCLEERAASEVLVDNALLLLSTDGAGGHRGRGMSSDRCQMFSVLAHLQVSWRGGVRSGLVWYYMV